jgi:hypothetical protein
VRVRLSGVDDDAPGWDAITTHVEKFYPGQEPVHRAMAGTVFGSPLEGLSAYRGPSWWYLVTYGLTELFTKESEDREWSGWGYEFTMRVPLAPEPPDWPFGVLASLAKLTRNDGTVFGSGHRLQTGHPLAGLPTRLTAVAFTLIRSWAQSTRFMDASSSCLWSASRPKSWIG